MHLIIKGKKKKMQSVFFEKNKLKLIDQRVLPFKIKIVSLNNATQTAKAIKEMIVRGAPAIGVTAAYGIALEALKSNEKNFWINLRKAYLELKNSRPTAFDLFYAIKRMKKTIEENKEKKLSELKRIALNEAKKIEKETINAGKMIGLHGSKLIKKNYRILTHCNAGWLAFVDFGSALSPIYFAKKQGKNPFVFVDETRPRLQGAKLTAFELLNENIKHAIIADNTAGLLMQKKEIDLVIVGADRIALNGDIANKIGTYEKAVLAKENKIPFYVAAPFSTFDFNCKTGKEIPIEKRSEKEVLEIEGENKKKILSIRISLKSKALNYAFDVTPAKYIKGIITQHGIIKANKKNILKLKDLHERKNKI